MPALNPSSTVSPAVAHLRTLPAVRERCTQIFNHASNHGGLTYFSYDVAREDDVADYCINIIKRDFGSDYASIPPHGRWRHFDVGGIPRITTLLSSWAGVHPSSTTENNAVAVDRVEAARRLVDLFMVSVLLDAGAGPSWKYEEKKTGLSYGRSEGLAVASLDMFTGGRFCGERSDGESGHKVTAEGLKNLSPDMLAIDMQVHPQDNPMTGLEGRTNLLIRLGEAVAEDKFGFFSGPSDASIPPSQRRPGFLVDYLCTHPTTNGNSIPLSTLWEVLMYGLAPIWPASRTHLDGVAMGDVWPNATLANLNSCSLTDQAAMVPFHKLSQWMCYSLIEAMEKTLGWQFTDAQHGTGLPEYRNGGLFVDLGVLTPTPALLKESQTKDEGAVPSLPAEHPAIVEWRSMTVILLDRAADKIRQKLGVETDQLNLKQVLEAATWKGGREIAKEKRPHNGGPPIDVISDGTVF
ncbi:related to protein urg3 [Ustilago trichophora]|uniref:Related to protein urg3 n=1 Tax=Ustilago trichophora TaxID=86804 RepID=A0A5C3E113_9BASI|nr:related to protein urg3 [Ustilago trichophora]